MCEVACNPGPVAAGLLSVIPFQTVVLFPNGNMPFPNGNKHRLESNWEQGTWEHGGAWEHFGNMGTIFPGWEHGNHTRLGNNREYFQIGNPEIGNHSGEQLGTVGKIF